MKSIFVEFIDQLIDYPINCALKLRYTESTIEGNRFNFKGMLLCQNGFIFLLERDLSLEKIFTYSEESWRAEKQTGPIYSKRR